MAHARIWSHKHVAPLFCCAVLVASHARRVLSSVTATFLVPRHTLAHHPLW